MSRIIVSMHTVSTNRDAGAVAAATSATNVEHTLISAYARTMTRMMKTKRTTTSSQIHQDTDTVDRSHQSTASRRMKLLRTPSGCEQTSTSRITVEFGDEIGEVGA